MDKAQQIFKGNVQIYLQGQNALIPVGEIRNDRMTYFIGSKRSKLLIQDNRENPILAAQRALLGLDCTQFADIFGQSAYAEIFVSEKVNELEEIEIHLYPTTENGDFPVLWVGVIDDLLMPMLDSAWEILRPISLKRLAFAAMVKAVNFIEEETTKVNPKEATYSFD